MISFEKGFTYSICGGDTYGWKVSINGRRRPKKEKTLEDARARVSEQYLLYLKHKGDRA